VLCAVQLAPRSSHEEDQGIVSEKRMTTRADDDGRGVTMPGCALIVREDEREKNSLQPYEFGIAHKVVMRKIRGDMTSTQPVRVIHPPGLS